MLTHPDQSFVTYVLDGLQNGFRVGFNPTSVSLKLATQNMPSASLQLSDIDDYLYTELAKGRVAGPFYSQQFQDWAIPLPPDKLEGPFTFLTVLGISVVIGSAHSWSPGHKNAIAHGSMINRLSAFRREDHPIRLNREFQLDLLWWLEFFQSWNGHSFLLSPRWAPNCNGVISGLQSGWNSVRTIQQWSRCCGPVHHEIRT